ncbi:Bifunctional protein GlmU [Metallosphaera sp. J1]|uniref:nucleotidyltransferase family protein n=1 Tax=Metallosphaera javensis (ex Hofmann et al. 2022) TaxID=99938 RepID=UPI001EDE9F57|nr:nucleotidyltransferase family protein [Metallosphaera javensis (ex Hofmann et al. 2022)]MCG3109758.1 Bifunctional protein GlmU [Metallosphaera javensis (ex Hofmann et al. 2022)]
MKALILAGGFGKRLRPFTDDKPKPLLEIAGKPILEWQILWLKKYGIREFVILTGYKKEALIDWASTNSDRLEVNFVYSVENEPMGTGGAIRKVRHFINEDFLVVNGDILTNLDVNMLSSMSIALVPLKSPYGIVEVNGEKVARFVEKPTLYDHWINAGVYRLSPSVFDYLPEKGDIERTTFPKLAEMGLLRAVKFEKVYWRSIDSVKDMEEAGNEVVNLV